MGDRALVYGAIGGSITQGAAATPQKNCYPRLFAKWLDEQCPGGCTLVNAGIGASNSLFGAYRAREDLLNAEPDLITIEYAVNDVNNPELSVSYENLVRQCIAQPNRPAVVLIFTMKRDGTNCQEQHVAVGRHYGLPMLSYRDAIYPDVGNGTFVWEDISPDEVHPNNAGHRFIADMLQRLVADAGQENVPATTPDLPVCLHPACSKFDGGRIVDATAMDVISVDGWTQGAHKAGYMGWQADTPGATLSLRFTGRVAFAGYKQYAGDFGRASVVVDGGEPVILDGFFERPSIQAWAGGHTVLRKLFDAPESSEHVLTVELLAEHHPDSNGHAFDFGYLLLS